MTDLGDMAEDAASDGAELLLRHDALQTLINGRQWAKLIVRGQKALPGVDSHLVWIFIHLGTAGNISL